MKPLTSQQIADQQKQAATTGSGADIRPASAMKAFDHSQFQISYPENWQVFGDKNSSVTIAPQSGVSDNAVAYGVIVNSYQPGKLRRQPGFSDT